MTPGYDSVIDDTSQKLAAAFLAEETDLVGRVLDVDRAVRDLAMRIGRAACERVFEALARPHRNGSGS